MYQKISILVLFTICLYSISFASLRPLKQYKAELNATKTHYFVSLKAIDDAHPGYTAVYDAVTHEMKFKIDTDLCSGMTYLSPNGEKLVSIRGSFYNHDYPKLNLSIYDSSGLKSSTLLAPFIYTQKELVDVEVNDTNVCYIFRDSIWSVSTTTWQMTKTAADYRTSSFDSSFFYKQTPIGESLFSLPELAFEGLTLKERVLQDLNLPDGTITCAKEYISISVAIDSTGKIIQLEVLSFPFLRNKKGEYVPFFQETSSEMQQKIIELIQNYSMDKANLHDGANFWVYKGGFYI